MMCFLTFHGLPKQDLEDSADIGGAYINCYIQADNLDTADKISRLAIGKMNWDILELEEAYEIDVNSLSNVGRDYYEQALIDKTVFVFHTYPFEKN